MEAERFAAQIKRPAPDGRALLCAANHARETQGITASQKRNDARNRASVTPVSLHIFDVSAPKGRFGVSRGARKPFGVLAPFVSAARRRQSLTPVGTGIPRRRPPTISPPPDGGNPPAGGHRHSPSASADNLSAAEGGNFSESFIKALPEQRPCAPATESASRSFAAQFLLRVPVRRSTAPPCARW